MQTYRKPAHSPLLESGINGRRAKLFSRVDCLAGNDWMQEQNSRFANGSVFVDGFALIPAFRLNAQWNETRLFVLWRDPRSRFSAREVACRSGDAKAATSATRPGFYGEKWVTSLFAGLVKLAPDFECYLNRTR